MSPAPPAQRDKISAPFATNQQSLPGSGRKCTSETMERDRIGIWGSGDGQSASRLSGLDRLKHPGFNKVRP
ncbi:Malic enzyme [Operophtera brumata]|uniref:Malic enzyme n=1 Tax=Operophtera brumata TaxID=104452 RepID=A0A0L7KXE8_OPEBR|nr:Malic enzyme [Operophtera brumata]